MGAAGKILVFVDLPGGELDETGRGMLSYASRLAGFLGAPWGALTPVTPTEEQVAAMAAFGVPEIRHLEGGDGLTDTPELIGLSFAQTCVEKEGTLIAFPHNDMGSTLAPIVAATLNAALLTEVVGARPGEEGLQLSRQALGGRLAETRVWNGSRTLVLTVPAHSLSQVLMPTVRPSTPRVLSSAPVSGSAAGAARIIGRIPPDPQTVDLTEAEVIFSVGKGCDEAIFEQFKELCRLLNVSFGVTRPVYDMGWTGFERMIGQTGRTVTPRLYLALGISGSMHHVGGIKDSRRIIAVNSDSKAPIFPNVDEGFVADLREVLPRLLERAQTSAGGAR